MKPLQILIGSFFFMMTSGAAEPMVQSISVLPLQQEDPSSPSSRYDWGPSVMRDVDTYRMWWVRLGGDRQRTFTCTAFLRDGSPFGIKYPDFGDRIYYAESRDGKNWNIATKDYTGPASDFGPDSAGPLRVLGPAETDQERNHVGTPSVLKVDGTFYMYYEACSEYAVTQDADGKATGCVEYNNQVFVAESKDAKTWQKYPSNESPQPVIPAPASNREPGRRRYGLGQPSACYRDGTYILHYVDSCTGPGDFIVRVEADNPYFRNPRTFYSMLPRSDIPNGSIARFAQTKVNYLNDAFFLVRPAYGTGNLGLLSSKTGVFAPDADAAAPKDVFPQIAVPDPRGSEYTERLFPSFLTTPEGQILVENGNLVLFYSSGRGFKEHANTWDLYRCEVPRVLGSRRFRKLSDFQEISRQCHCEETRQRRRGNPHGMRADL